IFSNYVETPGGFGFGPIGLFPLDPGESVDFTVATWSPWPIGGSAGDPVPLGAYEFPASAFIHITYTEFIPFIPYSVDFSNAGSFVWHVTDGDEVIPEPMTAGLALISVGALSMVIRRRRDRHIT